MKLKFSGQHDVVIILRSIVDQLYYEMTEENIIDEDLFPELALVQAQLLNVSKMALERSKYHDAEDTFETLLP